jgi:predicted DNA-binding WGR domain protein
MYVKLHKSTNTPAGGKWWEAETEEFLGNFKIVIRFGADGASGQTRVLTFPEYNLMMKDFLFRRNEKINKGYVEVRSAKLDTDKDGMLIPPLRSGKLKRVHRGVLANRKVSS